MEALFALVGLGIALIGVIRWVRLRFQKAADRMRRTYLISFPRSMSHDEVLAFVRSLSGMPAPKFLQPVHGVVFETYADVNGIKHLLHIPGHVHEDVDGWLTTHINGASLTPLSDQDDPVANTVWQGVELSMRGADTPIRIGTPEGVAATVLSAFSTLPADSAVVLQWILFRGHHQAPVGDKNYVAKVNDATFNAVARIGATGEDADRLIRGVYAALSTTHAYGVKFTKRPRRNISERIAQRKGTLAYPIFLNATELTVLMGWPFGAPNVAGLSGSKARHLAPDQMIDTEGVVVASSNYPKLRERKLAIPVNSLLVHTWVSGPSGVGKSVVLHNIAEQIMKQGLGLILIEPKADLAHDVLMSVPRNRVNDVIWFDPTDTTRPIGLNVLSGHDPERITGHIVGMFQTLYGDSWGSRLERILRYSVLTAAMNGLTLYDVKQLLVNKDFRQRTVRATKDPEVRQFWHWLDDSSDTYVDSVVNKLDSFLGSRAIRNIVGQQSGIDMEEIVRKRQILLVPLPSAQLGQSNAAMLGSLMRDMLWDAVLRRPPAAREPIVLMMDEFQNYGELSTSKSDPFAEARSYGMGLVIAN
jgi:hypothetical protein